MEINTFTGYIPIEEYLVNHTLEPGDLVCVDSIINLQNITNHMTIGIPRMKPMTVVEISFDGIIKLSTHPINQDVKSLTKMLTSSMVTTYVIKKCCLVSDIPVKSVTQGNLFDELKSQENG